jgi:homocitrate synthase NifV
MQGPEQPRAWLVDTTLRDGEQTPGVCFTARQKRQIARLLADAGVPEIEAGNPAMGAAEQEAVRGIVDLRLPCRLTAWCRARRSDVEAALRACAPAIHVSFPVSEIHLHALARPWSWVLQCLDELLPYCRDRFEFVSVGAQDASRAGPERLVEMARRVSDLGGDRLRLADTVGIWSPAQTADALGTVHAAEPGLCLGFHGHNDLGMATANSLAAWQAGATTLDVTVNGLGERTGNAPLEQVTMALRTSLGHDCGVDPRQLLGLSSAVAQAAGKPVAFHQPVVGDGVFTHESGIHVHALLRDARTYEPYAPELVGRGPRNITVGKHSGTSSLDYILRRCGLRPARDGLTEFLHVVRLAAEGAPGGLSPHQLSELYQRWLGGRLAP